MWQDGLALLIVVIAAVVLLRSWLPSGLFRLGARRNGDGSARKAPPAGGCGGCALGASCFKAPVKVYPVAVQPTPSNGCRWAKRANWPA